MHFSSSWECVHVSIRSPEVRYRHRCSEKPRINALALDAGGMIDTTEEVSESSGASSGNECLQSWDDYQISDQNDKLLNVHADIKAKLLQTEKIAALAQAAKLLLKISRKASKHMAGEILLYLKTSTLYPADHRDSSSNREVSLNKLRPY